MPEPDAGSFGSLSVRPFRILLTGTLLSFTAFFTSTVVQAVVAFELTGTNTAVGSAIFGQGLGMTFCGPLGGALADRLPKRRVIAAGQLVSSACFGTLAALYASGSLVLMHLVISSFLIGCAFGFLGPARQALAADLVTPKWVGSAMALTNVVNTISRVLGPFVAGVLLASEGFGAAAAYATMSLLYFGSAVLLLFLPRSVVRDNVAETHVLQDLTGGLSYVWGHVELRNLLIFFVSVMLIGFPHVTLIPGLLENQLGRPAEEVTRFAFFSAIGAFAASVTVARYADSAKATRIYSGMAIAFGIALVLLAGAPGLWSGLGVIVLVGASSGGFHALNGAVIARRTDPEYMGRVMSLTLLAFAGFSLTALPLGILADVWGERVVLAGMGVVVTLLSIYMTRIVARDAATAEEARRTVDGAEGTGG
ncbi:MAG: MFS transporter [Myxococcota bacterium]